MQPTRQLSFILRLWCTGHSQTSDWQASLEIPETGKRIGFSSLEQLFANLLDFTESKFDVKNLEVEKEKALESFQGDYIKSGEHLDERQ